MSARGDRLHEALDQRIGTHIKRVEQHIVAAKTEGLRPLGLTVPQYAALFAIDYLQPTSAAQLAREAMLTQQTMSTILANLESKNLVIREPSQVHQKVMLVRLTDAGERMLAAADAIAAEIEEHLRARIGDDDFAALKRISATITASGEQKDGER